MQRISCPSLRIYWMDGEAITDTRIYTWIIQPLPFYYSLSIAIWEGPGLRTAYSERGITVSSIAFYL